MTQYVTKDSGARAQFDSGMQRDTEDGKARFDLLHPLGVPYGEQFLTRCAELLGRGAVKYDARNWEKASSEEELARFKSSAARHFEQWLNGEHDEDHAAAVFFNLLAHETTAYKLTSNALESGAWEALPHLFDMDGDVWQQIDANRWAMIQLSCCGDEYEPQDLTLDEVIECYGLQGDTWVEAQDLGRRRHGLDGYVDVGFITEDEAADAFLRPYPTTIEWGNPEGEAIDLPIGSAPASWTADFPRVQIPADYVMQFEPPRPFVDHYQPPKFEPTGDMKRALAEIDTIARIQAKVYRDYVDRQWAVLLEHTGFVVSPEGETTDVRQMVQDALNRRF